MVEPLERVDRLRRGLVDVDQQLMRTDLEVLRRLLVLERAADHAIHVLLGGQRYRARHRGTRALSRFDDLFGGRLDRRVVIGLEPDPDLVLCNRCKLDSFGRTEGGPGSYWVLPPNVRVYTATVYLDPLCQPPVASC